MRAALLAAVGCLCTSLAGTAFAAETGVAPRGKEPVLAAAIDAAADGDTLRIARGVYRETITLRKRLHLVGEEGAILDPSQPFPGRWQPAPEVGPGV